MLIMGIETSCDDSSVGIMSDGALLSSYVYTQKVHQKWGGVIPELASRDHIRTILSAIDTALKQASIGLKDLDCIASCAGPGLLGSLLVGLCTGKSIARVLGIPFVGVHHLEGHFFASLMGSDIKPPLLALIISGGHTHMYFVPELGVYKLLGKTRDDAAGEAFDKGAKAMGLPYPGGPAIEKAAIGGNPDAINLPRAMQITGELDMSFSGLKTALINKLSSNPKNKINLADFAASYQEAIVDSLIWKINEAASSFDFGGKIVAVGGVAANSRFRQKLIDMCNRRGWLYSIPDKQFCTDNGAMIAAAGEFRYKRGNVAEWDITAVSRWALEDL
ncbi:tRNA (adenosine(37)-N6)-threonylcarbamoyltransferase complex transferase subunit TsaD [bacterium]|nr:tRNA (adenosine(37)-N6)-threonylcarbamoyltransferase complex transferase subunit TsaD [bacterium]